MKRVFTVAATLLLVACQSPEPEVTAPKSTKTVAKPKKPMWEPPPSRAATPNKLLNLRLNSDVGTFEADGQKQNLVGFGLNSCQTGFYVQGFAREEDKMIVAPLVLIPRAKVPIGKSVTPLEGNAELRIDAKIFSLSRVDATLEIFKDGKSVLRYDVDGEPSTIANVKGLGQQGCFSTGEFSLSHDGRTAVGPVTAVHDNSTFYLIIVQLTERHQIYFHLDIRPHLRKPNAVIRGALQRIAAEPKKFPFRVTFVEKSDDLSASPPLTSKEWIAKEGNVVAAWQTEKSEGPIKLALEQLRLPDWDGPLAGELVDLRTIAGIVADPRGISVPHPATLSPR